MATTTKITPENIFEIMDKKPQTKMVSLSAEEQKKEGLASQMFRGITEPVVTMLARPFQAAESLASYIKEPTAEPDLDINLPYYGTIKAPKTKQDLIKDIGRGIETVTLGVGGGAGAGLKTAAKQGLKSFIKKGVISGGKVGALFGAGAGLEEEGTLKGMAKGAITGTALGAVTGGVLPVAGKGLGIAGKAVPSILKRAGMDIAGVTLNPTDIEKEMVAAYKATKPTLMQRISNLISGKQAIESKLTAPITEAETLVRRVGAGTEKQIGIDARRVSDRIWETEIAPALKSTTDKIDTKTFFSDIEKKIVKETADLTRRRQLLKALEVVKEDFKNVSKISYEKLQDYKSGWAEFVPEKFYKGEPIAGALNEIRGTMAKEARGMIYDKFGPRIKQAYLDWGNLQSLAKEGIKGAKSMDTLSFTRKMWETVLDNIVTPVTTIGGKVLYKTGQGLEYIGNVGAKTLRDILGSDFLKTNTIFGKTPEEIKAKITPGLTIEDISKQSGFKQGVVPQTAELGITSFRGKPVKTIEETLPYYETTRSKGFESSLSSKAPEYGLKVQVVERSPGFYEGNIEPSWNVRVVGTKANQLAYAAEHGFKMNQDSVALFWAGKGNGVRISFTVENPNSFLGIIKENGIVGAKVLGKDVIIYDIDNSLGSNIIKITKQTGYEPTTTKGTIRFLEKAEYSTYRRGQGTSGMRNSILPSIKTSGKVGGISSVTKAKALPTKEVPLGVKGEFKVGDILDPQGKTNMVGKVKIREITGNTLKFTDSEGTEFGGMQRSTVRTLVKEGAWKKVSQATESEYQPKITEINKFKRAKDLSPENRTIENKAYSKILSQEDQILSDYKITHQRVVNADDFKKYFKDEGYTGHNAVAVQEPSSYLAGRMFTENLKNPEPFVSFYAGSSGSGKTSAIKEIPELTKIRQKSAVILDSNLSNEGSAIQKVNETINVDKKPYFMFVARKPMDALHGVISRMFENPAEAERLVPTKVIADNMIGSWYVQNKVIPREFPGAKQFFIDNFEMGGTAKFITKEEMASKLSYPPAKEITDMFNKEITKLYNNPEISKKLYGNTLSWEQYKGFTD